MDPLTSSTTSSQNSLAALQENAGGLKTLGKDEFLKLLVTKLQNQDPLKPLEDEDFIAQLAQFSSLEQMYNIAESIENANNLDYLQMQSLNNSIAASFVGKDVQASYNGMYVKDGNPSQIAYSTTAFATEVTFTIKDASGNVVAVLTEENVPPGAHTFTWDGRDKLGNKVDDGYYTLDVTAESEGGGLFSPQLSLTGTVEAVVYRDSTPYLRVNGVEIPLSDVTAIGEKGVFDEEG